MAETPHPRPITLLELIDRARRIDQKGDLMVTCESLAQMLGIHAGTLAQWRVGKRLPSDEAMITLCAKAQFDPMEGLMLLNIWRTKGRVRSLYMKWWKSRPFHYVYSPSQGVVWSGFSGNLNEEERETLAEQIPA